MKVRYYFLGIIIVLFPLKNASVSTSEASSSVKEKLIEDSIITLFFCGDVMTGRGIDQILPYPGNPRIFESYMKDARGYIDIAERRNGEINYPVDYNYIWGDALEIFETFQPDLKIINLETSITTNNTYWPGKSIQYRMNPKNIECLKVLDKLYCSVANNHILDWKEKGLEETIFSLRNAGIHFAGAGSTEYAAGKPAIIEPGLNQRILVFSIGMPSAGVFNRWEATNVKPGVCYLKDFSGKEFQKIQTLISEYRQENDIVIVSIHWGGNWGYDISDKTIEFAHNLVDNAQVDIIHGHSSHHFKAFEIYKGKPIFYGCGDFINDYEGIRGHEEYRSDLVLMYFVKFDTRKGVLVSLEIVPLQLKKFRLNKISTQDNKWVKDRLERECKRFGIKIEHNRNTKHYLVRGNKKMN